MGKTLLGHWVAGMVLVGTLGSAGMSAATAAAAERFEGEAQLERLRQQLAKKQYVESAATIERIASESPQVLSVVRMRWIQDLVNSLKEAGRTREHRELLAVLASPAYIPAETLGSNDAFRSQYAQVLFESGNVEQAGKLVTSLKSPALLARASLDPRYREFFPSDVDVRSAAEQQLAHHKKMIEMIPQLLSPTIGAAGDLIRLGRPQEAIDTLRTVEPRIGKPGAFADGSEYLSWWWNELGRAYTQLRDYDAAVESFSKGATNPELGSPNVSQLLNLAGAQIDFGAGEAALATLAAFGDREASAYGNTVLRFTRGCASAMAGRMDDAARDLAYLREHEKDSPSNLRKLLLCMGDLDAAAAAFIRHLEDPDLRPDALLDLSDYDEPPVAHPNDPVLSRLPALKARADVQAAIVSAGGVRRFRVQREGM